MIKKLLFLLVLLLTATTGAVAQDPWDSGDCTVTLNNGTLTVSGNGAMDDYANISDRPWENYINNITSVVVESGVTSVGMSAFYGCSTMTSVTLPEGLTAINDLAFSDCSSLQSITIPSTVTSIGGMAFNNCSAMTSVTLSEGLKAIGDMAFGSCSSLTSVTLPEGLTTIKSMAFSSCSNLTSITIPSTVTSIGDYAFFLSSAISDVNLYANPGNLTWGDTSMDFKSDKDTQCHVLAEHLSTYQNKFSSANVTFVGDLKPLTPPTYSVTLAEGTEDATNWQGKAGEGEYQLLPLEGVAAGTAVSVKYSGKKKVKSVKAVKKAAAPAPGLLSGVFSVSSTKKVNFSKGNLRYASSKWSFFDNQYDYYTSYSADAWDHFGWSTSTTTYGMNTSINNSDYSGDFVDWGATMGTGWFTLSSDEWTYLLNTRSASTVGGTADGRYAKAKVNNVPGVILFPDTYTHPDGVTAPVGVNATDGTGWNGNSYTVADWTKMESAGCVFLPVAGYRSGTAMNFSGEFGYYWSATPNSTGYAYRIYFDSSSLSPANSTNRRLGNSVRLVQEVTE